MVFIALIVWNGFFQQITKVMHNFDHNLDLIDLYES